MVKVKKGALIKIQHKSEYVGKRKQFDKCVQQAKRKFQLDEQKRLSEKLLNTDNPKEFWRRIGDIGMANERKPKIPLEVIDDAGNMLINKKEVIDKWKNDYENLYYENIVSMLVKESNLTNVYNKQNVSSN